MVKGADYNQQGASVLDGLEKYFTPFRDKVINPVLNDYDVNAGKTRAAQAASGAANGAFRGDRFALREAATEGDLARGRAATEGGLLSDMFTQATGLSSQDAARRQAAQEGNRTAQLAGAGQLSSIGTAQGANQRGNVALQGALGSDQSQTQTNIKQYPLEYQQALEGLFAGLDPSLFTGQTINSSGNSTGTSQASGGFLGDFLLALAGGAHQAAASMAGGG